MDPSPLADTSPPPGGRNPQARERGSDKEQRGRLWGRAQALRL
jgi:hypothetical protein